MKSHDWEKELLDEIQSLPRPDFEKEFNENKQHEMHRKLMLYAKAHEMKEKRGRVMKGITIGIASITSLILFSIIVLPLMNGLNLNNGSTSNFDSFLTFFDHKMKSLNKQYELVHTEFDVVHEDDAIAIFMDNNNVEQIFIAYFEKTNHQWEWRHSRGAQWESRHNWSSMNNQPYIYSGAIKDPSIKKVLVGEVEAKIITVEDNKRFWFVLSPSEVAEVKYIKENGEMRIVPEHETDVREAVWHQLSTEQKSRINGDWEDAEVSEVTLTEEMLNESIDRSYIGEKVYLIKFPTNSLNKMIIYADQLSFEYIGNGLVD